MLFLVHGPSFELGLSVSGVDPVRLVCGANCSLPCISSRPLPYPAPPETVPVGNRPGPSAAAFVYKEMTTLRFDISDDKAEALEDAAERLGISIDELLRASVDETLQKLDADFEQAAQHVVKKNVELYRRLA